MIFNINKCEVLQITLSGSALGNYCLYNNRVTIVNEVSVLLDSIFNFISKKTNDV